MNKVKGNKGIVVLTLIAAIVISTVSYMLISSNVNVKASEQGEEQVIEQSEEQVKEQTKPSKVVREYQEWLNDNYNTNLKPNGIYGCEISQGTMKALQIIYNKQYNFGLLVDGKMGYRTENIINTYPIKKGSKGELVELFQRTYNVYVDVKFDGIGKIEVDGEFTEKTNKAFKTIVEQIFVAYEPTKEEIHFKALEGVTAQMWSKLFICCQRENFESCPLTGVY